MDCLYQPNGKVSSRLIWPIRTSTQSWNWIKFKGYIILWNSSLFFIFSRFYRTQNNFDPSYNHMITEWVVTMIADHVQHWHLAVTCPITLATVKTTVIAVYQQYQIARNDSSGLCNINEWCVTWLIYRSHPRGSHSTNFLTAVTLSRQSNSKLNLQKNNHVPKHPVEQWLLIFVRFVARYNQHIKSMV